MIAKFLNVDKICLWLQCLISVIVGLNWLTIPTLLLIWLPRTILSLSQREKNFEWKTVPVRWWSHICCGGLFLGPKRNILKN